MTCIVIIISINWLIFIEYIEWFSMIDFQRSGMPGLSEFEKCGVFE